MRLVASTGAPRALTVNFEEQTPVPVAGFRLAPMKRLLGWPGLAWIFYLGPTLFLYGLFAIVPVLHLLWLSLQRWDGYGPQTFLGAANFVNLVQDPFFKTAFLHSELFALSAAIIPACGGLGLALLASRIRRPGLPLAIFFFPVFLPPTVVAAIWTLVYSPLSGLLNSALRDADVAGLARAWLGDPHLALPALFVAWMWSTLGVSTLMLWIALRRINREYFEVAAIEGASLFQTFLYVTLPQLRRPLILAALINIALSTQVFDLVYAVTGGGPGYSTMLLPIDMYGRAFGGRTGEGSAVAVIQLLLGCILAGTALLALRGTHEGVDWDGAEVMTKARSRVPSGALGLSTLAFLLPIAWLVLVAVGRAGTARAGTATGSGFNSGIWSTFHNVWNAGMQDAVATSLLLALGVVIVTLLLAAPAAFALSAGESGAWRLTALFLLSAGLFLPMPVLIVPLFSLLRNLHLLDSIWGILLPEIAHSLPFAILLLWTFLIRSSREAMEAAAIDGARPFQQMVYVALPLIRPALYAAGLWAFATSWNEYLLPTVVSTDGSLQTVPTLLASFIVRYNTQYDALAAASLFALAPPLLLYTVLHRSASEGLGHIWRSRR
ncbi:MAG: hypothetical protein NVSMB52_06010 [Chloroflexota bacterium]